MFINWRSMLLQINKINLLAAEGPATRVVEPSLPHFRHSL